MQHPVAPMLTLAESRDFQRLAGMMIPASETYGVPGADDAVIFADIMRSLGRDGAAVRHVLATLSALSGGAFVDLDTQRAAAVMAALLAGDDPALVALGRAILQCYYRDDRVITAVGLEPRAPFPQGYVLAQSDWSLLDAVRARPQMWRDV